MIQLTRPTLTVTASTKLAEYQSLVDGKPNFPEQVDAAKSAFKSNNVRGNATFDEVKTQLLSMSSGAERCHYCEDSKADEVEHLLPKDVYPNFCFDWDNYFYACGNCNGPKNNKCAVIDGNTQQLIDITPLKKSQPVSPRAGVIAIIDPANENPLDFFLLDLRNGSFKFSELPNNQTTDYLRAKYTLEILRLNDRPFLRKVRKEAFQSFKARLSVYITEKSKGTNQQLDNMILGIKEAAHQTVWQEMKRQHNRIQELKTLFDQAQEALTW